MSMDKWIQHGEVGSQTYSPMKLKGVLLPTANCRIEVLNSVLGVAALLKVASILRPVTACMHHFYIRPLLHSHPVSKRATAG
jgi:hypothetical protein